MPSLSFNKIDEEIALRPAWFQLPSELHILMRKLDAARRRRYLLKTEFIAICLTKSKRVTNKLSDNNANTIKKITKLAFSLEADPYAQILVLCSLKGVAVPRASCLLAWVFPERYPVIDWRAWKVLFRYKLVKTNPSGRGLQASHWIEYLEIVRQLALAHDTTPMLIDRWLWHAAKDL